METKWGPEKGNKVGAEHTNGAVATKSKQWVKNSLELKT
jgi:hypothetical protein